MHAQFSKTIVVYAEVFHVWSFSKTRFHCQVLAEGLLLLLGWAHVGKKDIFKTSECYHAVRKKKKKTEVWYLEWIKLFANTKYRWAFWGQHEIYIALTHLVKVKNEVTQCPGLLQTCCSCMESWFEYWAMVRCCWFQHVMDQPHNFRATSIVQKTCKPSWQSCARPEG